MSAGQERKWCQFCKGTGEHKYPIGGCRCSGASVGVWTITEATVPCPACNGTSEERRKGERRVYPAMQYGTAYRHPNVGWREDRRVQERRKGE